MHRPRAFLFNGAGIYNSESTLAVSHSSFTGNNGTSIYNTGTLTVVDSTFDNNVGATFIELNNAPFPNYSIHAGAGIFNTQGGLATVSRSVFSNNDGNGIFNHYEASMGLPITELTVSDSTFSNNESGAGGGIFILRSVATVDRSTFSHNSAVGLELAAGGGICVLYASTLTVSNSTFTNNEAGFNQAGVHLDGSGGYGGGISITIGAAGTVTNSTFIGNRAFTFGGGIFQHTAELMVTNSTISANLASQGGGIFQFLTPATSLGNTIIAGNLAYGGADVRGTVNSSGYNLIGDTGGSSGFGGTDLIGLNPMLGPLANNGGPTQTMALQLGSPAIDAGSNALIPAGVTADQRGLPYARISGTRVDIGAYELSVDTDGVDASIEDAGPNGGDGNGDGILDSLQSEVASLPNSANQQYVTLVSPTSTNLIAVAAIQNPSPTNSPAGIQFPIGHLTFTVQNIAAGGATTVTIFLPDDTVVNTYYKYGPTPDNSTPHWYEFLFDGITGAEIFAGIDADTDPEIIVLHFVDGLRGDDDVAVNGQVHDPGSPAFRPNRPPTAVAGGPYSLTEGATETLDGSGSSDPEDGTALIYQWDLNYDGCTFVVGASGLQPTVSFPDDFPQRRIALRVTDSGGLSSIATTTLVVTNVAPTATTNAYTTPQASAVSGNVITDNAGFGADSDPAGAFDPLTVVQHSSPNNGKLVLNSNGTFTYTSDTTFAGTDSFTYTISDGDGGLASATVTINVVAAAAGSIRTVSDSCYGGTALLITGTSAGDKIVVAPGSTASTLKVTLNGVSSTVPRPSGRIIVTGGDGDDDIQIAGAVDNLVWLYGNAGDDRLNAGNGGSLLIGGDGNDQLLGGGGRDIMIGGNGADNLVGNGNDDILVAGLTLKDERTSHAHDAFWCTVLAEWNSGNSFATRVQNLRGVGKLLPEVVDDVLGDQVDLLNGGAGDDWLIFEIGEDKVTGKAEAAN